MSSDSKISRLDEFKIEEVSAVDRAANKETFLITKRSAGVEKMEWTTEFINGLADSAFLFIEAGGEKDEDGKTVPRELRHLPVYDDTGALDTPHLQGAIDGALLLEVEGLSDDDKAALQDKARALLAEAEKADEGGEDPSDKAEGDSLHAQLLAEMVGGLTKMLNKLLEAVGSMAFDEAWALLDASWDILWDIRQSAGVVQMIKSDGDDLVSPLLESIKLKKAELKAKNPDAVTKSADPELARALARLGVMEAELKKSTEESAANVKKAEALEARIFKMESSPVQPQTGEPDGSIRKSKSDDTDWPFDLNQ